MLSALREGVGAADTGAPSQDRGTHVGARDVIGARRWVDEASLTVRGAGDRRDEFERLRKLLNALGAGEADPQLFLPADWREELAGVWNGDDLRGTERRLRRRIASRSDTATASAIDEQLSPYFDLEGLRARALLDAGRNEDALVAIEGVIQQGCRGGTCRFATSAPVASRR